MPIIAQVRKPGASIFIHAWPPTWSWTASFHHRSTSIHLLATEKSRPRPPVLIEAIMILVSSLFRKLSRWISRDLLAIRPVIWSSRVRHALCWFIVLKNLPGSIASYSLHTSTSTFWCCWHTVWKSRFWPCCLLWTTFWLETWLHQIWRPAWISQITLSNLVLCQPLPHREHHPRQGFRLPFRLGSHVRFRRQMRLGFHRPTTILRKWDQNFYPSGVSWFEIPFLCLSPVLLVAFAGPLIQEKKAQQPPVEVYRSHHKFRRMQPFWWESCNNGTTERHHRCSLLRRRVRQNTLRSKGVDSPW